MEQNQSPGKNLMLLVGDEDFLCAPRKDGWISFHPGRMPAHCCCQAQPWVLLAVLGEVGSSHAAEHHLHPFQWACIPWGTLSATSFLPEIISPCSSWPCSGATTSGDKRSVAVFLAHPVNGFWAGTAEGGSVPAAGDWFCSMDIWWLRYLVRWFPPARGQLQGGLGQDSIYLHASHRLICCYFMLTFTLRFIHCPSCRNPRYLAN